MITLVIGRRVQGKSTLAYAIALQKPTRVIYDPRRQFHTTDDIVAVPYDLYAMLETYSEIIVQPAEKVPENFELACGEIFDWVEDRQAPFAFLVDEIRFLDTPNTEYPNFDKLIRFSNPKIIDVIVTCHRPVDISTDIRAIADFWAIFKSTQEHDLQIIRARCGDACAVCVQNLHDKEFVLWDDGRGEFAVRTNAAKWYVPIERKITVQQ